MEVGKKVRSFFEFGKKKTKRSVKAPMVQAPKEFILFGLTKRDIFWVIVLIFIVLLLVLATYVTQESSLLMKTQYQLALAEQLKLYEAQNPDKLVLLDPEYLRSLPRKKEFTTDLWENYKSWLTMIKDLFMSWMGNLERTMSPDSFVKPDDLEEAEDFVKKVKEYLENVDKK